MRANKRAFPSATALLDFSLIGYGQTDGRTKPLIEMRGRIEKEIGWPNMPAVEYYYSLTFLVFTAFGKLLLASCIHLKRSLVSTDLELESK